MGTVDSQKINACVCMCICVCGVVCSVCCTGISFLMKRQVDFLFSSFPTCLFSNPQQERGFTK